MKKENKKNNKVLLILIVLVIVLIIIVISQCLIKENKKKTQTFEEFSSEYEGKTVLPRNIIELYNYSGEYDRDYLYKDMKVLIDYISYLNKNVEESNLKDFYNKNSSSIEDILGISVFSEFKSFFDAIKGKKVDENNFAYAEVVLDSSETVASYYYFDLNLYYNDEKEPIKLNVGFALKKVCSIDIFYDVRN